MGAGGRPGGRRRNRAGGSLESLQVVAVTSNTPAKAKKPFLAGVCRQTDHEPPAALGGAGTGSCGSFGMDHMRSLDSLAASETSEARQAGSPPPMAQSISVTAKQLTSRAWSFAGTRMSRLTEIRQSTRSSARGGSVTERKSIMAADKDGRVTVADMIDRPDLEAASCWQEMRFRVLKARIELWLFLEDPFRSRFSSLVSGTMVLLIVVSIAQGVLFTPGDYMASGVDTRADEARCLDIVLGSIFCADVLLRLWAFPNRMMFFWKPKNAIDLISVVPFVLNHCVEIGDRVPELGGLRWMLAFDPFLRLLKLCRYFWGWQLLFRAVTDSVKALIVPMFFLSLIVFCGACCIFIGESMADSNPLLKPIDQPAHAVHYSLICLLSISSGPFYNMEAQSATGHVVVCILMFVGMIFMAMPIAIVGTSFSQTWFDQDRILVLDMMRSRLVDQGFTISDARLAFDEVDGDGSGEIDLCEFRNLVLTFNMPNLTQARMKRLFQYFDADGDGVVSFHDFAITLDLGDVDGQVDSEADHAPAERDSVSTACRDASLEPFSSHGSNHSFASRGKKVSQEGRDCSPRKVAESPRVNTNIPAFSRRNSVLSFSSHWKPGQSKSAIGSRIGSQRHSLSDPEASDSLVRGEDHLAPPLIIRSGTGDLGGAGSIAATPRPISVAEVADTDNVEGNLSGPKAATPHLPPPSRFGVPGNLGPFAGPMSARSSAARSDARSDDFGSECADMFSVSNTPWMKMGATLLAEEQLDDWSDVARAKQRVLGLEEKFEKHKVAVDHKLEQLLACFQGLSQAHGAFGLMPVVPLVPTSTCHSSHEYQKEYHREQH